MNIQPLDHLAGSFSDWLKAGILLTHAKLISFLRLPGASEKCHSTYPLLDLRDDLRKALPSIGTAGLLHQTDPVSADVSHLTERKGHPLEMAHPALSVRFTGGPGRSTLFAFIECDEEDSITVLYCH